MTPLICLGCLLAAVSFISAEEVAENGHDVAEKISNVVVVAEDYIQEYDIMCHICKSHVHGEDCITMKNTTKIERKVCEKKELFCTRQWEKIEGKITTFTRGCGSADCESGCRTSDGPYKLEKCLHCCLGDLCNGEPASAQNVVASSVLLLMAATAVIVEIVTLKQ